MFEGLVLISAPSPKQTKWAATNLITNLSSRTSGNNYPPLLDSSGNTASYESCFKTTSNQLSGFGDKMVITVDLSQEVFVHSILAV